MPEKQSIFEVLPTLPDSELMELMMYQAPFSDDVSDLAKKVSDLDLSEVAANQSILRDEAAGWYWKRQFEAAKSVTENLFGEWKRFISFPCAQGYLGEAIRAGKTLPEQNDFVLENLPADTFVWKQAQAARLVEELRASKCGSVERSCVDKIIELGQMWALLEVVPSLSTTELERLEELSDDPAVLTKSKRHELREFIRLRSKKSKIQRT